VVCLLLAVVGCGDAALLPSTEGGARRELLQSAAAAAAAAAYTWQVPPEYVNSEAKLTVVGGCVLEVVTVRGHACALITETEPFYYLDISGDLLVNETLSSVKSKYVCWGDDFEDLFDYIDRHAFVQFAEGLGARGTLTACAINNLFEIACFGSNDPSVDADGTTISGQAEPPRGKFSSLSMGGLHGCALPYDAETQELHGGISAVCWGNDRMHQGEVPLIVQESILTSITYIFIQCGYEHNCALRSDNRITCWGATLDQQTAIPNSQRATATSDGGDMSKEQIYGCCGDCTACDCKTNVWAGVGDRCFPSNKLAVGWFHNCAIRAGCDVQCASKGVTCKGTSGSIATWYARDTACSCPGCLRPHELECWGYNAYGSTDAPPGQFKTVSVSYDYSCAVYAECNGHDVVDALVGTTGKSQCDLANNVICWGRNLHGQTAPPDNMCKGAERARLVAESNFNQTTLGTPPPRAERPACLCTPQGCDCLSQMPRLEFEEEGGCAARRASLPLTLAASLLLLAVLARS